MKWLRELFGGIGDAIALIFVLIALTSKGVFESFFGGKK